MSEKTELSKEFIKLFNGKLGVGSIPIELGYISYVQHTKRSKKRQVMYNLSNKDVLNAINSGKAVQQGDTVLCNGHINVRIKKDIAWTVIDLYKKK